MNRSTLVALSASLIVSALGCSGTAGPEATTPPATTVDVAVDHTPVAAAAQGRVKRIGEALGIAGLRADQRAQLEALAADAEARQETVGVARQALGAELAAQITAGTIDRAALTAKTSAIVDTLGATIPKDHAAFEAMHDILDPSQRTAFVLAMETNGHGPHLAGMMKGLVERGHEWAAGLGLSDAQHDAIEAILREAHHGMHHEGGGPAFAHGEGRGKALLEAFKGETFSFDAASPPEDIAGKVSVMTGHLFDVVEKALPILTPEQRVLAAQKVRDHLEQMPLARWM